ncbi:MAG: AraC family transcriptional regulator [Burkholderiales bacterium]|nr:AraC family transcriptional regulator [Burkholderiales bacterium]
MLAGMGVDVPRWLAVGGITEADLADSGRGLSFDAFQRLIVDAMQQTKEPALGLLAGERLRINTHGMLGYAAMNSGTLRQALDLFERFLHVRTTLIAVHHEIVGGEARLLFETARPLGEIESLVLEAVVLTVKNLTDHITMGACQIPYVCFQIPKPAYADLAHDMFKCEVRYGQRWTGYALPVETLDRPLSAADPATFEAAARICQQELDKRMAQTSLGARVRRILLERQSGFPSLQVTARLFNMTPRTLHRRLIEEGTSFRDILEEVRHMLAVQQMKTGTLSIQEIAFNLGYTDVANFRRAFKRWEHIAPSEYIARLGDASRPA